MKDVKKTELKLITIYGDTITIEIDEEDIDDFFSMIIDNLDNNEIFSVGNYGETATFKNHDLTLIDFKKIIGME